MTHRLVRLSYVREGQEVRLAFLRPAAVLAGAVVGGTIDLAVLELAVKGPAKVLALEPCPPIEEGDGHVVTGAFSGESVDVRLVKLAGLAEPLAVTSNHPVFSEDRRDFVLVSHLHPGERLRRRDGTTAVVESVTHKPGRHEVFNLASTISRIEVVMKFLDNWIGDIDSCKTEVDEFGLFKFRTSVKTLGVSFVRIGDFRRTLLELMIDPSNNVVRGATLVSFSSLSETIEFEMPATMVGLPHLQLEWSFGRQINIPADLQVSLIGRVLHLNWGKRCGDVVVCERGQSRWFVDEGELKAVSFVDLADAQIENLRCR